MESQLFPYSFLVVKVLASASITLTNFKATSLLQIELRPQVRQADNKVPQPADSSGHPL